MTQARSALLRLLVLAPFPPRRDGVHGGARVTAELLARLSQECAVALIYLRGPTEPSADDVLTERLHHLEEVRYGHDAELGRVRDLFLAYSALIRGIPTWTRGLWVPAFEDKLRELVRSWRPDIVQLEYTGMGQYVAALRDSRARRVLVEYDPAFAAAQDIVARTRGPLKLRARTEALAWKRFERRILRSMDAVVVVSERDARVIKTFDSSIRVAVIPLGAEVPERALDPVGVPPPTLLFVGSFVHPPNVDAAVRLARNIFPPLTDTHPDLRLSIVGHAPPSEIRALADSRIAIHGDVPAVTPYLERATVVVVPVRMGGGTRVKVLEALAAGKAVVASPRALEGITAQPGTHLLVADSDDEFRVAVTALLEAPSRRLELGSAAHRWAANSLSWEPHVASFVRLYESLLSSGPSEPSS